MAYVGNPIDTQNTFQSLVGKRFNGDGSTTAFTLDVAPGNVLDIEVFVGNVRQDPNSAYTLSGTTLTFTGAPPSGTNNIYVVHQAKSVGTIDVPAGGVAAGSLATSVLTGQTDIGAAIADADLLLVDDGAGGTLRKPAASRLKTFVSGNANDPAFHAYNPQNGSVANNTNIIVSNNTELFDSGSAYNTSDYKFTPQTAGYYFLYGQVRYESGDNDFDRINLEILKNGSAILASRNNNTDYSTVNVAGTVVANGSSDYFQLQSYHGRGSSVNITTADEYTFFGGFLIKTS